MAKKREVNYFKELRNDDDLEEFLKQDGLLILDIYQDLFGPCLSLHSCLEKAKLSLTNSDLIQLANCDAYRIAKLKRFRNKCQPTMAFCCNGKIVEIVYGANIPLLSRTIQIQLEMSELYGEGKIERVFYDFDEPLPFERDEIDRENAARYETAQILKDKLETETREKLTNVIELMTENASDTGVTLFMPHVAEIAFKKTSEAAKWLSLFSRTRKIVQIKPEIFETLNRYSENPIDADIMNYLNEKDILAVLWSADRADVEKILNSFVKNVSEPQPTSDEDGNRISGDFQPRILDPLIIRFEETNVAENESENVETDETVEDENQKSIESEKRKSQESEELSNSHEVSSEQRNSKFNGSRGSKTSENALKIPPVWTPMNKEGNALLMFFFFRKQFEHFLPPEEEPIPDHLMLIFPASKHQDVLKVCEDFPKELLTYGFFIDDNQNSFELICKTSEKYEQLPNNEDDKIIMKVAKRTSHLALALTEMNPLYVSHNVVEGERECSEIFNEDFYATQDVIETDDKEENEEQ